HQGELSAARLRFVDDGSSLPRIAWRHATSPQFINHPLSPESFYLSARSIYEICPEVFTQPLLSLPSPFLTPSHAFPILGGAARSPLSFALMTPSGEEPMRRLLCIVLVTLLFVLPARGDEKPVEKKAEEKKTPTTLAHIKLSGSLDEGPVSDDPIFGSL